MSANSGLVRVDYRPKGVGQKTSRAWASPDRLPTLREWLESLIGPLAHYSSEGEAPPSPDTRHDHPAEPAEPADPDDWRSEFDLDEEVGCGPLPMWLAPAGYSVPVTFYRSRPALQAHEPAFHALE